MLVENKEFYKSHEFPKADENIDDMLEILSNYGFEFLDGTVADTYEVMFEYVGEDMVYKAEEEFDNRNDWRLFSEEQGIIVCNHFKNALKEIEKHNIDYKSWEWCSYDYPVISVEFKLE